MTPGSRKFLDELEKAIGKYPNSDLLGPLILYHSLPDRIWFLGDRLIMVTLATCHWFKER